MTNRKILVFKHMPSQNPGIFRTFAKEHNVSFTEIDLHAGDPIPSIDDFDALWVMGGSMNVWEEEEHPWLIKEQQIIREVVIERKLPYLGICLGHQLLASALGGKVVRGREFEVGNFSIEPTEAGGNHPLIASLPRSTRWANVHLAEVSIPPVGAEVLARSERCSNHAMAFGDHAFSVQFHPEICETTLTEWFQIPGIVPFLENLLGQGDYETFKQEIELNRKSTNKAAKQLFENWLSLVF
jgi:GMP synthase-like glutamine amidotransferase